MTLVRYRERAAPHRYVTVSYSRERFAELLAAPWITQLDLVVVDAVEPIVAES